VRTIVGGGSAFVNIVCWWSFTTSLSSAPSMGTATHATVSEAHVFVLLPLGGTRNSWRWSSGPGC
jgi:hypothetical protein